MPDSILTTNTLKIENMFVDGDSRTITLKNPSNSISRDDITALNTFMQTNNVIIGDKYGGTFGRIARVTKINQTRRTLDINE